MENEIICECVVRQAFPSSVSTIILEEFNLSAQMILRFFLICDDYKFFFILLSLVE